MAFTQVKKRFSANKELVGDTIRMSIIRPYSHKTKREHPSAIMIYLGLDVVNKLGITHDIANATRSARRVGVYEGTHADAGYWMLASDPVDGYALNLGNRHGRMGMFMILETSLKHYILTEERIGPQDVQFAVDENERTVLIQLPIWLRYNSLSVPGNKIAPSSTQSPPPTQSPTPPPGKTIVLPYMGNKPRHKHR